MTRKQKKSLFMIIAAAVLLAAAMAAEKLLGEKLNEWIVRAIFVVPYLIVGFPVLKKAAVNVVHGQVFDENLLMTVATVGAFVMGECDEAVIVMLLYQIGELLESIAVGKTRKSVAEITNIRPDRANVVRDGQTVSVSPEEVAVGEMVVIRPGDRIPVDGVISEGRTSINTVALTGESVPRDAGPGDRVVSGTVNVSGAITVVSDRPYEDSTAARIIRLIEESSSRKAKTEGFITRFARYYTPVVLALAVLTAGIPIIFGNPVRESVLYALNLLVISCPCAIVISVPMAFFASLGAASKKGVLVKGSNYMEQLARLDTVMMDKTGTITEGSFRVTAVHPEHVSEKELLEIAVMAESFSTHPISASLKLAYPEEIDGTRIGFVNELPGMGVEACIDGRVVYVGNSKLMEKYHASWHECSLHGTTVHVAIMPGDHTGHHDAPSCDCIAEYMGHILVTDSVKEGSREAIGGLGTCGVRRTVMLTGDTDEIAADVAKDVGVNEYRAALLPGDKVSELEKALDEKPKKTAVAFVGDGINDAPVLSRADVGVAMGGIGSDAAIEAADVVIMDDDLRKLPVVIGIAKKNRRIITANIVFALGFKAVVALLSPFGLCPMWLAVFADVGVMLLAVLNSLRILRS
ncbi:MAG: heavy metal translocating P-type ATPase [Clostridia bacterium]|nr:heavy metal translocating P-type ATPase [Clostridia bacterium]